MYNPTKQEQDVLNNIENKYYMTPPLELIHREVSGSNGIDKRAAWLNVFDKLHDLMRSAQAGVEKLLEERKQKGKIKNIRQTRVSIVGKMFANLVVYIFIQNKIYKNIRDNIYITSKPASVKNFQKTTTIKVGTETQKPDIDLLIYTKKTDETIKKCIILSLKTSLRERAAQTYKWKLLMEIATTENPVKRKYNLEYNPENMPLMCFATVNFYNEINNPQQRGMLKFFDGSFIGKPINSEFVRPLSYLVQYVGEKL